MEDFIDFNLIPSTRKNKRWIKILTNKRGNYYNLFLRVLQDAKNGTSLIVKGGSYYSCAKFINSYHKYYRYYKSSYEYVTCCNAYPKVCGGECCGSNKDNNNSPNSGMNILTRREIDRRKCFLCDHCLLPPSAEHIRNCANDCCRIVRIKSKRKFRLTWYEPSK